MCGIVGKFDLQGGVTQESVQSAANALVHRGPDGEGVWVSKDACVGFGHRRLSIIDLTGGGQPLFSSDQSLVAVVNGEFYGYKEQRRALQQKGYRFTTESDSEILLALYTYYGLDCVQHLRGEFAFILYDQKQRQLIAGRDRFGIKPLCYHISKYGVLTLASKAKALFAAGIKPAWDRYAMSHVFSFQYLPQDRTVFEGVRQLKPGHLLIANATEMRLQKYWDISFPKKGEEQTITEEEAGRQLEAQLKESVLLRLQSDGVPYCSLVSGGVDSSIIAAMAARFGPQPLTCFTVSFPHAAYDELPLAQSVAKHIGADFEPVFVDGKSMVDVFEDAVFESEGLAINSHLSAKYLLNKAIHQAGFKFTLTGEGADEALLGYAHLRADHTSQQFEFRTGADGVVGGVHLAHGNQLDLSLIEQMLGHIPSFLQAKASIGYKMHALLRSSFKKEFQVETLVSDLLHSVDIQGQLIGRDAVYQSDYFWTKFSLANYILNTLGDGTEMAWSVEGRVPFLDHKFFEFAASLPLALKMSGGIEKRILRSVAEKYIPTSVAQRPKQAFMAPPLSLLDDSVGISFLEDIVSSHAFADVPFFQQSECKKLLQTLRQKSPQDQIAFEPVVMMMVSTFFIQKQFSLSV